MVTIYFIFFFVISPMKLYSIVTLLAVVIVAWCGVKTTSTPETTPETTPTAPEATTNANPGTTPEATPTAPEATTNAAVADLAPSCQKYLEFMQCVVSKLPDSAKAQTQASLDQATAQFRSLASDQQGQACDVATQAIEANKAQYSALGCEIK